MQNPAAVRLTKRELEVAALVAAGLTNRVIAERLFISERTVDGHLEHLREKLGVNNRAQIAAWYATRDESAETVAYRPPPAARAPAARRGARAHTLVVALGLVIALAAAALLVYAWLLTPSTGPRIETVAGTGRGDHALGGYSGDSGPAIHAQLVFPLAVALDQAGDLYINDGATLREVDPRGTILTIAGGGLRPIGDGAFATSTALGDVNGLAVDRSGVAYLSVSDFLPPIPPSSNQFVLRLTPDLRLFRVAGTAAAGYGGDGAPALEAKLREPAGLAIAADGTLYIADSGNHRVRRVGTDGIITTYAGNGRAGPLGDGGAAVEAELNNPVALALDAAGNLFIADLGNNRIRKVSTQGTISTVAGSSSIYGYSGDGGPATAARLSLPSGVAVDAHANLYIADTGNDRIRRVDGRGVITTVAGNGHRGFAGDGGPATAAELNGPVGIALDARGSLYIADEVNHRVRRVALG